MAGIRGDGEDFLLIAVERISIKAEFVIPKCRVEPFKQGGCLCTTFLRTVAFAERVKQLGHADPGAVNITLELAECLRSLHQRAVRIDDAVAGILPSHVLITGRRSRLVLLEAITIAVAIIVDPRQADLDGLQMPLQQSLVASCAPSRVQGDQIERRGVGSAIIGSMRDQSEMCQLTVAQSVE